MQTEPLRLPQGQNIWGQAPDILRPEVAAETRVSSARGPGPRSGDLLPPGSTGPCTHGTARGRFQKTEEHGASSSLNDDQTN